MSIETINIELFHWINSTATQNHILDKITIFCSHNLITIFVISLIILSFSKNKKYRIQFLKTLLIVAVSLLATQLIHTLYYHPRPFVLGLGHKLVGHGSSSSFPSRHTLTMATIAFSYLIAGFWRIGILGLITSLIVGWSRIYIGVHFPVDILGSLIIGLIVAYSITTLIERLSPFIKYHWMSKKKPNKLVMDDPL